MLYWRLPTGPGFAGGYAGGSRLLAFDAATGKQAWKVKQPVEWLGSYSTPSVYQPAGGPEQIVVAGDGKVYFISEEGKVSVIKAGADWEMLGSGEWDGNVIATPAIADRRIYIRTDETLYCFQSAAS